MVPTFEVVRLLHQPTSSLGGRVRDDGDRWHTRMRGMSRVAIASQAQSCNCIWYSNSPMHWGVEAVRLNLPLYVADVRRWRFLVFFSGDN